MNLMHYCLYTFISSLGNREGLVAQAMEPFDEELSTLLADLHQCTNGHFRRYPERYQSGRDREGRVPWGFATTGPMTPKNAVKSTPH